MSTDSRNFPTLPMVEPVWVNFIRNAVSGMDSWDIPFDNLADASDAAEQAVDDGEAESATMVNNKMSIDQTYTKDEGWVDNLALGDCIGCDGYILAASEAPYCPTCHRLKSEGKDL